MEKPVHRYLRAQAAVNLVANVVINGVIAWLLNRSKAEVTLAGVAVDLAITTLILTWIVSCLATHGARKAGRAGTAPETDWKRTEHPLLRLLPANNTLRGLVLAVIAAVVLVAAVCGLLALFGIDAMRPWPYIVFKALYTGALAAATAWVSGLAALGESAGRPAESAAAP